MITTDLHLKLTIYIYIYFGNLNYGVKRINNFFLKIIIYVIKYTHEYIYIYIYFNMIPFSACQELSEPRATK